MNFFPQPCLAHPESPKLRAKQGHAKSTTFAPKPNPHPASIRSGFLTFPPSNLCSPFRPLRATARPANAGREPSAFSLTEVVIAMGVAAVAFTSIIALFPLGLNMSKESYEATQAALIAQTILADVTDQQTGNTNRRTADVFNSRQIQITNNSDPSRTSANYILVPINTTHTQIQTVYIAYKPFTGTSDTDTNNPSIMRPVGGQLNGAIPVWYTNGSNGCFALVKATFSPTLRYNQPDSFTGVRLDISIETPGSANISNRTCFLYTTAFRP
jgi:type II secretory pathway pseudopilin PulG